MNLKRYYAIMATVFILVVLVASIISSCAPAALPDHLPGASVGVPGIVIEKRAIYDRENIYVGYRFYDSELDQYCYYIGGDLSCPNR